MADSTDDRRNLRGDLEEGLRFLHTMEMQTKAMVRDTAIKVTAVIQELLAAGLVDREKLARRAADLKPQADATDRELFHIRIGADVDKYQLTDLPDIDCASLLPLCQARCCTLAVFLSFQDLDERAFDWEYGAPYLLKRGPDSYCVHNDASSGRRCTVYDRRPAACRTYDCRNDKRIWLDFDQRIPAPPDPSAKT